MPAMAHVQRPGRIRGQIFDEHAGACAARGVTVACALGNDRPHLCAVRVRCEREVHEAGPSNVDFRDERRSGDECDQSSGEIPRRTLRRLRQAHSYIRREIPVLLVARALELRVDVRKPREFLLGNELVQSLAKQIVELGAHDGHNGLRWKARILPDVRGLVGALAAKLQLDRIDIDAPAYFARLRRAAHRKQRAVEQIVQRRTLRAME
jgi:hypothetical protein